MELKIGKRYWFCVTKVGGNGSGYGRSRSRVRSGLYGGERDPHNGNAIIHEKTVPNGVYQMKNCIHLSQHVQRANSD